MAELEHKEKFAELLLIGISALKQHPDYKTVRKKRETLPSGQFSSESYVDKIAVQLGVSSNTVKSWMGQMGTKYIPSRIEDGKLFGIAWLILEKSELKADWLNDLLRTTSIPVLDPPVPNWISSCFRKAKLLKNDNFGAPSDQEIQLVVDQLFGDTLSPQTSAVPHNLPTRWSDSFVGRKDFLHAIASWLQSPSPVCFISGWGGMGKTTIALEAAYACAGEAHAAAAEFVWPHISNVIWISADLKSLSFGDFLDVIAYQLGRVELLDKSANEKRFLVRNALSSFSDKPPVLLIVDSIDTADHGIREFILNLPRGVKALLTARENMLQTHTLSKTEMNRIQLDGFPHAEALEYLEAEIRRHIRLSSTFEKTGKLEQFLAEPVDSKLKFIDATAGNPKAIALAVAQIAEDDILIHQLIEDVKNAGQSLTALFDYLFGRAWERCSEDAKKLWQVLSFFGKPASEENWKAVAGLDRRRFFLAVDQLRGWALIDTERMNGQLHYRAHQTVLAYGEQFLSENESFAMEARQRWSQYYLEFIDTHLKREQPLMIYWRFLLGRDLEPVKLEWPNIAKLLEWASASDHSDLLIQLMLRLSHFLSRVSLPTRIEYGLQAARAALKLDREALGALFLIDTAGWALIEVGLLDEGLRRIEAGIQILENMNSNDPEVIDLMMLGFSTKARLYLKRGRPDLASEMIDKTAGVECSPLINHRILLVQGDICLMKGQFQSAIQFYEEANKVSEQYGGEKTIEAFYHLGIAYLHCDDFERAEASFEQLLYKNSKANQIEIIYYQFGMAQLLNRKGKYLEALQFTKNVLAIIDSWERTIWLREEVERFHGMLTGASGVWD